MDGLYPGYLQSIKNGIRSLAFPQTPAELYDPIVYTLDLGGKRIRPILALMASDLHDGNQGIALNVALGIELFHNFTLLHDDIMDEAPLRRGKPTVHEKWNENIAILSGDAMMIKAYEMLSNCPAENLPQLLRVFNETAFQVCEGQQFDMNFESETFVTKDDYIDMIKNKTSVLLGASLKMGAIAANADEEQANLLYDFGVNVGIAFQLKDDWLDVYGDPEKFGKMPGGDILAGKKTYLMITALEKATPELKEELVSLLNSTSSESDKKVERVVSIYNQLNVGQAVEEAMNYYFDKAMTIANSIHGDEEVKSELLQLSKTLLSREI